MSGVHVELRLKLDSFMLEAAFSAPATGVTALFGPSGSGKTTLLRCIAGLEQGQGSVQVNGETWQDEKRFMPVHQRPLGYVFQEASLFPHLSVRANLEFGYRRIAPGARSIQPEQVVEWLGLGGLAGRADVSGLSGGERQRVAIGRALLTSPRLLLLDEPLAALDSASKQDILPYLESLHGMLNIPVLYISHALDEVARLADHLVLLQQGRVLASGTLAESLARLDLPLAHLDEAGAVVEATVASHDERYHLTRLDFSGGCLWLGRQGHAIGSRVRARVLARDVSIATTPPQNSSIANILDARISAMADEGPDKVNVQLLVGAEQVLLARITRRSRDLLGLATGMPVFAQVKSVALM